jgi:hypothetical protein
LNNACKGFLNQEQKERLQTAVRTGDCPRLRSHALILLLQNDGKTYKEIADFIGCGYRTVADWCVHGNQGYFILNLGLVWYNPTRL